MESGTEGLFYLGREAQVETSPEVENIYERIEGLSDEHRTQFIRKLIHALTTDEAASVLDEIAVRLHKTP